MTSHPAPGPALPGGRVPLARSFAFRLGVAFAAVAIAAAGITALVVNAAFAARFDRYLHQQQHAQVTRITMAAGRAYAGGGKWDLHALATLVPAAGSGTVRVLTPSASNVWQWNGHQMSWNNQWMQHSPAPSSHHGTGHGNGGNGSSGQGSSDQGSSGQGIAARGATAATGTAARGPAGRGAVAGRAARQVRQLGSRPFCWQQPPPRHQARRPARWC